MKSTFEKSRLPPAGGHYRGAIGEMQLKFRESWNFLVALAQPDIATLLWVRSNKKRLRRSGPGTAPNRFCKAEACGTVGLCGRFAR